MMTKIDEEQRKIDAYVERKRADELERKRNEIMKRRQQTAYRHQLATQLFDQQPDVEGIEHECYRRAVDELAIQWKQQQHSRKNHVEQMRKERIENHAKELERIQKLKESESIERMAEVENRAKNEAIDIMHECQRRAQRARKANELQEWICSQIETQQKWQNEQLDKDRANTNRDMHDAAEQEDQTFLSYANKLMNMAKSNGRPILPLVKVMHDYQKQHRLLPPKNNLPHLKSKIEFRM